MERNLCKNHFDVNKEEREYEFEECSISGAFVPSTDGDLDHTVICIQGGPGLPKEDLAVLSLLSEMGYNVLLYDPHNVGDSEMHPEPYSLQTFHRELEAIISEFSSVTLLGHSWGSMLILDYMTTISGSKPLKEVNNLILTAPLFDTQNNLTIAKARRNLVLDADEVALIQRLEQGKNYEGELYDKLEEKVSAALGFQKPHPEFTKSVLDEMNEDMYENMWGPSEFEVGEDSVLRNWSVMDSVDVIDVPVLLLTGERDLFGVQDLYIAEERIEGDCVVEILDNASHTPMWEQTQEFLSVVSSWLDANVN